MTLIDSYRNASMVLKFKRKIHESTTISPLPTALGYVVISLVKPLELWAINYPFLIGSQQH